MSSGDAEAFGTAVFGLDVEDDDRHRPPTRRAPAFEEYPVSQTMTRPSLAFAAALVAPVLIAGSVRAQDAAAPPSPDAVADAPIVPARPLGALSDPDTPPKDLFEALVSGRLHLDDRLRYEYADTTGRRASNAVTNRLRLGYGSKPFHGFSGYVEMENVATPDRDAYWVPATGDGNPARTVIADPTGTEVNQAYGRYDTNALFDSDVRLDLRAGRQRITLDDSRFIGNVGWRQFEQTYDAVSLRSDLGVDRLDVFYAYVWQVRRIFGPDGPNWDSNSHFINASVTIRDELRVTPFAYLLDFDTDAPAASSNSYGVRITGTFDLRDAVTLGYAFTYARQSDAGSNPVDYDADFLAAEGRLARRDLGALAIGYQFLGSDDGIAAFNFPLGTNHAFQGFADQFLATPPTGLQDLYVTASLDGPWGLKPAVTVHGFWSDEGSVELGTELDVVVSKAITANWSVLLKGAFFDGRNGQPDTDRVWLQTSFAF